MHNDIAEIIELLRQNNNRNASHYNDSFIDGIHRNFPDLLYNNTRFTSVQSVMEYINHQMNNNYNIYNRNFTNYWNARTSMEAPPSNSQPVQTSNTTIGTASNSSHSIDTNDIFAQIHNDMLNGARILNNLSNITNARTQPSANSSNFNINNRTYMDDEVLLNGINPAAIPAISTPSSSTAPSRPPRIQTQSPLPNQRRHVGAREIFRNLLPDFLNFHEPTLFMATARTFHINSQNEINESDNELYGLSHNDINRITHAGTLPEGQCPICYDDYSGNNLRIINNCNHAFHAECIDRWFINNRTCPMCRINVLARPPTPPAPSAQSTPSISSTLVSEFENNSE
jgi:hypothetical protein